MDKTKILIVTPVSSSLFFFIEFIKMFNNLPLFCADVNTLTRMIIVWLVWVFIDYRKNTN